MDESQHSNYFQFFEWKDKDGNDTNIYARLRENKARPLLRSVFKMMLDFVIIEWFSKKEKDEKTGLGKKLVQKKLDKMVSGMGPRSVHHISTVGHRTDCLRIPFIRRNND